MITRPYLQSFFGIVSLSTALAQTPSLTITKDNDSTNHFVNLTGIAESEFTNWELKSSTDLITWKNANLSSLTSGEWAFPTGSESSRLFFRASYIEDEPEPEPDPDLYDLAEYRIMELEFEQANWASQLAAEYGTGVNLTANLSLDGELHEGVGVRYKGDTSYRFATTAKKSFGIYIDETDPALTMMGYKTLNLNNAFSDASFMREVLYNNFCRQYIASPKTNFVHLFVNGADYGVYVNAQQENGDFLNEVFVDNDGDRWRAGVSPAAGGGGGPGGPGGSGLLNFGGDLSWLGNSTSLYEDSYILKSDKNPDPYTALANMIDVLNNTSLANLPDELDQVMAVDRFLWMLALESLFIDGDGYLAKTGDYLLYHDINTGRIHPIQHDGNETFNPEDGEIPGGVLADPFFGEDLPEERPLTAQLFAIDSYRQRYLAHLRTILAESYTWDYFEPRIAAYRALIEDDVLADNLKLTTNAAYLNNVDADDGDLRDFIETRRNFLLSHDEVDQDSPIITSVGLLPSTPPVAGAEASIAATVGNRPAVNAVTLYYTTVEDGAYTKVDMTLLGTSLYRGKIPGQLAGTTVYYYVEAQADDAVGTLVYFPTRAESAPSSYQVSVEAAPSTQLVINEFMADNETTITDSAGEYDDWIELRNLTDSVIDVSGMYLSDNANNPLKWSFPEGTTIEANGYLIIWADEDGDEDQDGLHANFKLSSKGETITLIDTDANDNLLLDSWTYVDLADDASAIRTSDGSRSVSFTPTPGAAND